MDMAQAGVADDEEDEEDLVDGEEDEEQESELRKRSPADFAVWPVRMTMKKTLK